MIIFSGSDNEDPLTKILLSILDKFKAALSPNLTLLTSPP